MSIPLCKEANERCMSAQEGREQLLPGIPDEITLHQIISKLPWKSFFTLSLVNRAWLHGIRSRQVYDARVVSESTETLVTVFYMKVKEHEHTIVGLYSKKDNSVTKLPPIPYYGDDCQWVSLDGKIYLLAGEPKQTYFRVGRCSNKVFVFDVAGQRQWEECASMIEARTQFGCGIIGGKIYVFGGLAAKPVFTQYQRNPSLFCGSEVYDPKENRWSPISPMTALRYDHRVVSVGDELFVLGGMFFDRGRFDSRKRSADDDRLADRKSDNFDLEMTSDDDDSVACSSDDSSDDEDHENDSDDDDFARFAKFLEVYNPIKDEWRVVNPFGRDSSDFLFVLRGKLYSMDWYSIHAYDGKDNSWTRVLSISFPISVPADSVRGELDAVIAMDDGLFVRASWLENGDIIYRRGDFQSKGFWSKSEELVWQKSQFEIPLPQFPETSNRLIQL